MQAQIVTIGKEILTGRILDTNSRYVARKLAFLGITLIKISIVDDDISPIAQEVSHALAGPAEIIFTLGGLGPTFDDITLEGVARACGRRLMLDPLALEFVQGRYRTFLQQGAVDHDCTTPEREKMAWLPEGSQIMDNPVGAAPGVILEHQGHTIFCLPGVPAEMEAIFQGSVEPRLARFSAGQVFLEESFYSGCKDESVLAPIIRQAMEAVPGTYLKSCADRFHPEENLKIVASAMGRDKEETRTRLAKVVEMVKKELNIS